MVVLLALGSAAADPAAQGPPLTSKPAPEDGLTISSDGVVELNWQEEPGGTYRLEHRVGDGDFALRYEGPDQASIRSGLAAGEHIFRVRRLRRDGSVGPPSELRLEVRYMEPARVRLLLITGSTVVTATVIAIVFGHLSHRKEPTP